MVFVAEIPRSNVEVMSPFHQFIITLVDFQIQYKVDDLIKVNGSNAYTYTLYT